VIDVDCKTHPDAAVCQIAAAEKEVESDKHAPESVE
jgi:hypothetical protein